MNSINHIRVIECLKQLADVNLQKRLWLSSGSPEVSSFVEAVEGLFTDSGLGDALDSNSTGYSIQIETKLRALDLQIRKVQPQGGPLKIIDDPAMPGVRALANEILTMIVANSQ